MKKNRNQHRVQDILKLIRTEKGSLLFGTRP